MKAEWTIRCPDWPTSWLRWIVGCTVSALKASALPSVALRAGCHPRSGRRFLRCSTRLPQRRLTVWSPRSRPCHRPCSLRGRLRGSTPVAALPERLLARRRGVTVLRRGGRPLPKARPTVRRLRLDRRSGRVPTTAVCGGGGCRLTGWMCRWWFPRGQEEALARFVRCLLAPASEPVAQRAEFVVEVLDDLGSSLGTPSLAEVLNAHPDRIEDFDAMLGALGALVEDRAKTASSWNLSQFQQMAIEVAVTLGGADGLARLARDATLPRPDQVWKRWMTELAAVGRLADAIEIGAEAIATIDPSRDRAQIADLHSYHQRQAGDQREPSPPAWSRSVTAHQSDGPGKYWVTPTRPDNCTAGRRCWCRPACPVGRTVPRRPNRRRPSLNDRAVSEMDNRHRGRRYRWAPARVDPSSRSTPTFAPRCWGRWMGRAPTTIRIFV